MAESSAVTGVVRKRPWTNSEDERLTAAIEEHGERNWKAKAAAVGTRDHVQCLQRWLNVLKPRRMAGIWTEAEDRRLSKLVEGYLAQDESPCWSRIARKMRKGTARVCRERWHMHVKGAMAEHRRTRTDDWRDEDEGDDAAWPVARRPEAATAQENWGPASYHHDDYYAPPRPWPPPDDPWSSARYADHYWRQQQGVQQYPPYPTSAHPYYRRYPPPVQQQQQQQQQYYYDAYYYDPYRRAQGVSSGAPIDSVAHPAQQPSGPGGVPRRGAYADPDAITQTAAAPRARKSSPPPPTIV